MQTLRLALRGGYFQCPVPSLRDGGVHNRWAAVLYYGDGTADREFPLRRGYDPDDEFRAADFQVGDVIELAHDVKGGGPKGGKTTKMPNRWYGVVRSITKQQLDVERYGDMSDAFRASHWAEKVSALPKGGADLYEEQQRLEHRIESDRLRLREVRTLAFVASLLDLDETVECIGKEKEREDTARRERAASRAPDFETVSATVRLDAAALESVLDRCAFESLPEELQSHMPRGTLALVLLLIGTALIHRAKLQASWEDLAQACRCSATQLARSVVPYLVEAELIETATFHHAPAVLALGSKGRQVAADVDVQLMSEEEAILYRREVAAIFSNVGNNDADDEM